MAALDRVRQGSADDEVPGDVSVSDDDSLQVDRSEEEALRARLADDPNDIPAFDRLAQIVRSGAAEGHVAGDPQRAADDAVWALAEEVAHNGKAWYPLIELARLSIDDDREVALRRLSTAAERDPSGIALAQGLQTLRDAGHAVDALNLGVGHWRPREHTVEAARQLIEASLEAERHSEARRHLEALSAHPDTEAVEALKRDLGPRVAREERSSTAVSAAGQGFADAGPAGEDS